MKKMNILKSSVLILLFIYLTSCGQMAGEEEKNNNNNTQYGFVSAKINWPDSPLMKVRGEDSPSYSPMPDTIKTVTMTASGGGMLPISQDFNANDKSGELPGIPLGNKTLTCEGKDINGKILYRGIYQVIVEVDITVDVTISMEIVPPIPLSTDDLVAYYPFKGNANDGSGNGNDGTLYNVLPTADRFGNENNAFDFDGTNGYIDVGAGIKPTFPAAISAWVWLRSSSGGTVFRTNNDYKHYNGIWVGVNGSGAGIGFGDGGLGAGWARRGYGVGTPIPLNTWNHVVWIVRGATDMEVYVNGQKIDGTFGDGTGGGVRYSGNPGSIGRDAVYSPATYFNGKIDEVRVYKRDLAEAEIQDLYNEESGSVPAANAGTNQSVVTGLSLRLDGSGSSEPNSGVLTYNWSISSAPAGSNAALSDPAVSSPSFVPDLDGAYVFSLFVDNGNLSSGIANVTVTASSASIPVANAGIDQTVSLGTTVNLDGSGSTDPDGDPLTFSWTITGQPPGNTSLLSGEKSVKPTFVPEITGTYDISLKVNDGTIDSNQHTVTITVVLPVAEAGPNQQVSRQEAVTLDGSGSADISNQLLVYNWTIDSTPQGSGVLLSDNLALNPTLTPDLDGDYIFSLVVNNRTADSLVDTVTITASSPIGAAGADKWVSTGSTVNLDGSSSTSTPGATLTYTWQLTGRPIASNAALSDTTAVAPAFIADKDGVYDLTLIVNNGFLDSAIDNVQITATTAPIAHAGPDQNVSVTETVTLDGSASSDSNGAALSYSWTISSVPAGSGVVLSKQNLVNPTFTPDLAGDYAFSLIVNNLVENSAPDTVTITASLPIANAGPDFNPSSGSTVQLDGRGSNDQNGNLLTYAWSITNWPIGSVATISDTTIATPTFTPDLDGIYELTLVVNNGYVDSLADIVVATRRATLGTTSGIFSTSFEAGVGSWSASNGDWQVGVPTAGPGTAYVDSNVAATVLDGSYSGNSTRFESPSIQLPVGQGVNLSFWHWYSFAGGPVDYGKVQVLDESNPGVWVDLLTLSGGSLNWSKVSIDLSSYSGKQIKIGFYLYQPSNYCTWRCSWTSYGWYLDEILVEVVSP